MSEQIRNRTALDVNYERAAAKLAFEIMTHSEAQAERIARHYMAHAHMAATVMELVYARRYNGDPKGETTALIERLVSEIKRNHFYDFGIALEWNERTI